MKQFWSVTKSFFPNPFKILQDATKSEELAELVKKYAKTPSKQIIGIPLDVLTRIITVLKIRTPRQLEQLHRRHVLQTKDARFPKDIHHQPIGWSLEKRKQFEPFEYGPKETLAYNAYQVNTSFSSIYRALYELKTKHVEFTPKSMLDFGAGPGTACWAAREQFESLEEYRLIEPSQSMIETAKVTLEGFPGVSIRRNLSEMLSEISNKHTYDLVVANYVLTELPTDYQRVIAVSALWKLVSPNGKLVLVDRGSSWGSYNIRSARQLILDSKKIDVKKGIEAKVIAPCTHSHECPMDEGTWCHFYQRSPNVRSPLQSDPKRAQGFKTSKFSYVVMEKAKTGTAPQSESEWGRLIRGPLVRNGHVTLDVCLPDGTLERRTITKKKTPKELRGVYRSARKGDWGGLWLADVLEVSEST